jgi:SRSO17 transposase
MRSHFVFLRVRPASDAHRRAHRGQDLSVRWLIAEWPPTEPEPSKYWISDLPATTPRARLIRLAKLRWRIEHDYRELKDGLGLDHYEGRTWHGWHHHATLVTAAHAFCTRQRLTPKQPRRPSGMTLYAVLRELQTLLARLTGACPTCKTRFPTRKPRYPIRS